MITIDYIIYSIPFILGLVCLYLGIEKYLHKYDTLYKIESGLLIYISVLAFLHVGYWILIAVPVFDVYMILLWLLIIPLIGGAIRLGLLFRRYRYNPYTKSNRIEVSLQVGAIRFRPNLIIQWAGRGIEHVLTYWANELEGKTLESFLHSDSLDVYEEFKEAVMQGHVPFDIELQIRNKNGDIQWLYFANQKEVVNGELVSILTGVKDITYQKQMEAEAELLKEAIHTAPVGISISSLFSQRQFLYCNHAEAAMHGWRCHDLYGKSVLLFVPPALRDLCASPLSDINRLDGWKRETINIRKDGEVFPVRLQTALLYRADEPYAVVSISEEIAPAILFEGLQDRAGRVVDVTSFAHILYIIYFDVQGCALLCNSAVRENLGYQIEDLSQGMRGIVEITTEYQQQMFEMFLRGTHLVPLVIRTKDGQQRQQKWVKFSAAHGMIAIGFDVPQS